MGTKVISELASWFRKLDATSASLFILVFAAVALLRSPEIKSAVAAQELTWWPELVEPVGWAAIAVALRVLGVQAVVRLRVALSPKYRFRRLARRADALAVWLSNDGNYRRDPDLSALPPRRRASTRLETAIAAFKADLNALGVCRTPPIEYCTPGRYHAVPGGQVSDDPRGTATEPPRRPQLEPPSIRGRRRRAQRRVASVRRRPRRPLDVKLRPPAPRRCRRRAPASRAPLSEPHRRNAAVRRPTPAPSRRGPFPRPASDVERAGRELRSRLRGAWRLPRWTRSGGSSSCGTAWHDPSGTRGRVELVEPVPEHPATSYSSPRPSRPAAKGSALVQEAHADEPRASVPAALPSPTGTSAALDAAVAAAYGVALQRHREATTPSGELLALNFVVAQVERDDIRVRRRDARSTPSPGSSHRARPEPTLTFFRWPWSTESAPRPPRSVRTRNALRGARLHRCGQRRRTM